MFNGFKKIVDLQSPAQVIVLGLAAIGLIGTIDHLTGYEISISIFYLIPVAFVTWHFNRRAGYLFSVISSIMWLFVDHTSGHTYSHWTIPLWNASVRLAFFLVTAVLLAELKDRLSHEKKLARIDDLTQVLNARAFKDITSKLLQQAVRNHHPAALGFIDLDNFKVVNDSLGHSEGDRVLKAVAVTLARCVRAGDILGRLGGDEFIIFMSEINRAEAETSFRRIREELVEEVAARGWPVGFSIGVALFPSAPSTVDEALKIADHLMYRVKNTGKNNIIFEDHLITDGESLTAVDVVSRRRG